MTDFNNVPFVTISSRQPTDDHGFSSGDSAYGSSLGESKPPPATHDTSRVSYHVKRLPDFARALEDSAARAFPNRGGSQRYRKVYVLLLYWDSDDLFVLPELEDLDLCFQQNYNFETERFVIPSGNAHLDLMLKIGAIIKEHESTDTLLIVYYGGHARIDDARQSTWCASRSPDSPWLQWSAIQTLLERSLSDTLILLDCCAGAASAAFPTGSSITETISASSWDAIAPNPGRYSFTSTLLEVLQEWKRKTFSVAMLHAEILARLKHPRPERRNGNRYETRTTPVHFMMTANHKAPSIELCRISGNTSPLSPPTEFTSGRSPFFEDRASTNDIVGSEPTESIPHVMISLALEDEQNLNVDDWERWLATIPALARYVRVQGVFKSHSTLLLVSLPVMVWDMLPDHHACNFVGFIRSNNLATQRQAKGQWDIATTDASSIFDSEIDGSSTYSSTTAVTTDHPETPRTLSWLKSDPVYQNKEKSKARWPGISTDVVPGTRPPWQSNAPSWPDIVPQASMKGDHNPPPSLLTRPPSIPITQQPEQIHTHNIASEYFDGLPTRPTLPAPVEHRLEEYFVNNNPKPTVAVKEFLASSLGLETVVIDDWFQHRREQQAIFNRLQSIRMDDQSQNPPKDGARMLLPGHLNQLLEIFPTGQIVIVDLRSSVDYQRSHIHGAVNFRAPASFVLRASMEMIERALADEASRSSFDKWYTSKCVVFYDKVIEYPWEAPVAEALFQKFKSKYWPGQCFVLKGHYREFSQSFDKYIVGANTTSNATEYLAGLQDVSWEKTKDDHQRYDDWLKLLNNEERVHTTELPPAVKSERLHVIEEQQQDLEAEFGREFPHLHRQAQTRQPDDNWSVKAPMVAHLERGIAKMQHMAGLSHSSTVPLSGGSSYLANNNSSAGFKSSGDNNSWRSARDPPQYTPYPNMANNTENLATGQGHGVTLHKSSSSSTLKGKLHDDSSTGTSGVSTSAPTSVNMATAATLGTGSSSVASDKRLRSSSSTGKSLFTRIIRSGRPDTPSR